MGYQSVQLSAVLALAAAQHGVVSRAQLLTLGLSAQGIKHRVARGRLFPVFPGVYSVGTPSVSDKGQLVAALLVAGEGSLISHASAAALWRLMKSMLTAVELTVQPGRRVRIAGIRAHRTRTLDREDVDSCDAIPVTSPARTIIDIAPRLEPIALEGVIVEADKRDLITPAALSAYLESHRGLPGAGRVREILAPHAFRLTDSALERQFLPLARRADLPVPQTGVRLHGWKVDFFWPDLGLVVETDGLRYHRTPTQQARDRLRDQVLTAAGLTCLRFTHWHVAHEPGRVVTVLRDTAAALRARLDDRVAHGLPD